MNNIINNTVILSLEDYKRLNKALRQDIIELKKELSKYKDTTTTKWYQFWKRW